MKIRKLYPWLLVLVVLTPLGIITSGSAWGEWTAEEVKNQVGFAPKGMMALGHFWHGYFAGYNIPGFNGLFLKSIGYISSATLAIMIIFIIFKSISLILPDEPNNKGRN